MSIDELKEHFSAFGQEHVFRFWDQLSTLERDSLVGQAEHIDLELLRETFRKTREETAAQTLAISPPSVIRLCERGGEATRWAEAKLRGEELLRAGKVAPFVVAGGQGTRLGFPGPKGAFPVGPLTQRSIFEIQAEKIRGLARRTGAKFPWYVMTSDATDADTRHFFATMDFFGLSEDEVFFLKQATSPAVDFQGRLILESRSRIFESPNGHGGSLTALNDSGALDHMERRGIETLFYYQVDNPLVRICDPAFIGFHAEAASEASSKVVAKCDAAEKMGVVALVNDRLGIVEYTELDEEQSRAVDESGELLFWAGNMAVHLFERDFIRRMAAQANQALPLHPSAKKIPFVDEAGEPVAPEEPNGYKLERFVFDALPFAQNGCVVEASRTQEFSPIKNAEGADSPATARVDLIAEYHRWLGAAGVQTVPGQALELDHSAFDGPDDVLNSKIEGVDDAGDTILTAAGDQ